LFKLNIGVIYLWPNICVNFSSRWKGPGIQFQVARTLGIRKVTLVLSGKIFSFPQKS